MTASVAMWTGCSVAGKHHTDSDDFLPMSVLSDWPTAEPAPPFLLSPVMKGLPVGQASALALGPARNANERLFEALPSRPSGTLQVCAALFAVDPFVGLKEIRRRLEQAGIDTVANWPSVGLFDTPFLKELAGKGLGFEREVAFVEEVVGAGFRAVATVFTVGQGLAMHNAGADSLLLHPPLANGRVMPLEAAMTWAEPTIADLRAAGARVSLYVEAPSSAATRPGLTIFSG